MAGLELLLRRSQKLLRAMLIAMEAELAGVDETTRRQLLFGPRGMAAQMPKLMQLAAQLANLQLALRAEMPAKEEAYPPISDADLKLLTDWLES